jgi:lipoprotein-releasing system ATP-binding protein
MSLVQVRDLCKSYHLGGRELPVLKGVDLEIGSGMTIAVTGPSGVGKSTLLHLLGALDRPTRGEIQIGDAKLWEMTDDELAHLRASQIGFVFQFHHLLAEFSAIENVFLAGLINNARNNPREKAAELLRRVGLGDRLDHKPGWITNPANFRGENSSGLHWPEPLKTIHLWFWLTNPRATWIEVPLSISRIWSSN